MHVNCKYLLLLKEDLSMILSTAGLAYSLNFLSTSNIHLQVGYKELCIHMASDHGGLERVMANDEREGIRDLVAKIRR